MLGRESAMDGASAEARGGRMPLVDSDGSNDEAMITVVEILEDCDSSG
jgi:hypothetical protein